MQRGYTSCMTPPAAGSDGRRTAGLAAASAYLLWGVLPLYFAVLAPTGPVEIVGWRIVLSFVFCAIVIALRRRGRELWRVARRRRTVLTLGLASLLIVINWTVFLLAVTSGHAIEAALGYYLNPLVSVLLGTVVLKERLRPLQWLALALAATAVVVLVVGHGRVPWYALLLAVSFALYGFVKKQVAGRADALSGFTIETAWAIPLAVLALGVVAATSGITMGTVSVGHTVLLLASGAVTSLPLLLFAVAAGRLTLVEIATLQYIAPTLQFLLGVFVLGEPMAPERWIGFGFVWVALVVITVDLTVRGGGRRRGRPGSAPTTPIEC